MPYNRDMSRRQFTLWHSIVGTGLLLIAEWAFLQFLLPSAAIWLLLLAATAGAIGNVYVATEVIEEVRNAWHMLWLLSVIVAEFVILFAFEYGFLLLLQPASFPTLPLTLVALLMHSVMVFVFNPLYIPATAWGQELLLVNTLGALGLVMFILQNLNQFRRGA